MSDAEADILRAYGSPAMLKAWAANIEKAVTASAPPFSTSATATPAIEDITTFEELCKAFPQAPVTLELLGQYHTFVDVMNENNKIRNTNIRALERRGAELEAAMRSPGTRAVAEVSRPMAGATLQ